MHHQEVLAEGARRTAKPKPIPKLKLAMGIVEAARVLLGVLDAPTQSSAEGQPIAGAAELVKPKSTFFSPAVANLIAPWHHRSRLCTGG